MTTRKKDTSQQPSPSQFASLYAIRMIDVDMFRINPSVFSKQLCQIIQGSDISVLYNVMISLFSHIETGINELKNILVVKETITALVMSFQDHPKFICILVKIFNKYDSFPAKILKELHFQSSFPLSIPGIFSKHSSAAKLFISEYLIPLLSASPKIYLSHQILFELFQMQIPGFNYGKFFQEPMPLFLSPFGPSNPYGKSVELSLKTKRPSVSILSIVNEMETSVFESADLLSKLIDFYQGFNEAEAVKFLYTIVSSEKIAKSFLGTNEPSKKASFISVIKTVFDRKKLDYNVLVASLDQDGFPPLSVEGITSLFSILQCFFGTMTVNSAIFTAKWRNKQLQLSILTFLCNNKVSLVNFLNSERIINYSSLNVSPQSFIDCNHCWLSLDFIEVFFSLIEKNICSNEQINGYLSAQYPSLVLSYFCYIPSCYNEETSSIASDSLKKIVANNELHKDINFLWTVSSVMITNLLVSLYQTQPSHIDKISHATSLMYQDLILNANVQFATDYAFASGNTMPISGFIKAYVSKHKITSLLYIIDFVKNRVTKNLSSYTPIPISHLNSFFQCLFDSYELYTIELKSLIRKAYMICQKHKEGLKPFNFVVKINSIKINETKTKASNLFAKIFDGTKNPEELASEINGWQMTDPILFDCITHYLLNELKYLSKHSDNTLDIIFKVISSLINSMTLTPSQYDFVFSFIKYALNESDRSVIYIFASKLLYSIIPIIKEFPQFVTELLKETPLRDKDNTLYEKVQKIAQLMNEPFHINHIKYLSIHSSLLRFERLKSPTPAVCKAVQILQKDPSTLGSILTSNPKYHDWIANFLVSVIQDKPLLLKEFANAIMSIQGFNRVVFQAASYQALHHINAVDFDSYDGGLVRRRLIILGRLIGHITLAQNHPIIARFLNLKTILLYAFSQGRLYGVVPFVCAVLGSSSSFFLPPNPYTASILSILATIYVTDSLKTFIKLHISALFKDMNLSISSFQNITPFFPEKTQNNFDFLIAPFSLIHMVSQPDIEKLVLFEEQVFSQFASSYVYMPETPTLHSSPDLREKIRSKIISFAYDTIKGESSIIEQTASSTAIELISKDLGNGENFVELAHNLTIQLCSSLTMFTAPMTINRKLITTLRQFDPSTESDWIESVASKNYEWISQLLRDIVRFKTWRNVQSKLNNNEESKQNKKLPPSQRVISNKPIIPLNVIQIYSEISNLQFSPQPFSQLEILQAKDKMTPSYGPYDEYLNEINKQLQSDPHIAEYVLEESRIENWIKMCPDLSGQSVTFEQFKSVIKTFLLMMSKYPRRDFESIACRALERVTRSVPSILASRIQSYVLMWFKISIKSPYVIGQLIKIGLLSPKGIDALYSDSLNSDPFNAKNACYVTQFLHYAIIENSIVDPIQMMSTLSIVSSIPVYMIDMPPPNQTLVHIEELKKVFENMDMPEHHLSPSSKLQMVSGYDPTDSISNSDEIISCLNEFKSLISNRPIIEDNIINHALKCSSKGVSFFNILFFREKFLIVKQFMRCLQEKNEELNCISVCLDSLYQIIIGLSHVVSYDMRKYYNILRLLMGYVLIDTNNSKISEVTCFLHKIRPIVAPSFCFSWIELVTDKSWMYRLLKEKVNFWPSYALILSDYAASVSMIDHISNSETFDKVYKSFLRFITILAHDYSEFLFSTVTLLLSVLPFNLSQLRNILLSLPCPSGVLYEMFSYHNLQNSLSPVFIEQIGKLFSAKPFDNNMIISIIKQIEHESDLSSHRYIIYSIVSMLKGSDSAIKETPAFELLCSILQNSSFDLCFSLINIIADFLRNGSPDSIIAYHILYSVIECQHKTAKSSSTSEIILRVLFERVSTPPPHPSDLISLVRFLLSRSNTSLNIWEFSFIKNSQSIRDYLEKIDELFGKHTIL